MGKSAWHHSMLTTGHLLWARTAWKPQNVYFISLNGHLNNDLAHDRTFHRILWIFNKKFFSLFDCVLFFFHASVSLYVSVCVCMCLPRFVGLVYTAESPQFHSASCVSVSCLSVICFREVWWWMRWWYGLWADSLIEESSMIHKEEYFSFKFHFSLFLKGELGAFTQSLCKHVSYVHIYIYWSSFFWLQATNSAVQKFGVS